MRRGGFWRTDSENTVILSAAKDLLFGWSKADPSLRETVLKPEGETTAGQGRNRRWLFAAVSRR
jgi:hypothetical protein